MVTKAAASPETIPRAIHGRTECIKAVTKFAGLPVSWRQQSSAISLARAALFPLYPDPPIIIALGSFTIAQGHPCQGASKIA